MRDLVIALIVFGAVPFVLARPIVGAYLWAWVSYMNPHRLSFGWAYHFPFAAIVAGSMLIGTLFTRDRQRIPWNGTTLIWGAFILWMNLTTLFALVPEDAWKQWDRVMKIQLMTLITLMVVTTRERLQSLIWVIALSIGYFAVRNGFSAIVTQGQYIAWGPADSYIYDNNHLALAVVMVIPLWWYLRLTTQHAWVRNACLAVVMLSVVAVLTSYSRGAFLAIIAMTAALIMRSRAKFILGVVSVVLLIGALLFMPAEYYERIETIKDYQQDTSAMGRINAWTFAWNLALDRPFLGGGFDTFDPELFKQYAPNPLDFHDAHSIYFEVLGEQGFVGLALYVALFLAAFRGAGQLRQRCRDRNELRWANDLGSMLQVCIVGYAVGGAFLSLAYFDLPYHLVAIIVIARQLVDRKIAELPESAPENAEHASMMPDDAPSS
jgi:probable O-glycosylation ligase (exosortase A-associated)